MQHTYKEWKEKGSSIFRLSSSAFARVPRAAIMNLVLVLVLSWLLLAALVMSECGSAVVFNFGDSNSDTGGCMAGLGTNVPPPHGRLSHQHTGRLCDGRLIVDFLCENLTISYLSPYLEALESAFKHGANFAISGAGTRASASNPLDLHVQVLQFLHFKSRSAELSKHDLKDVITEEGFQNALYLFDIGQNDLYGAFASSNFSESIKSTVAEIKNAIQTIYDNGGKNFWVHNTGPFGCLPDRISVKKDDVDLDPYGCLVTMNNGAKELNSRLSAACDELSSELKNATVVYVDIYSIKYDIVANYSQYGFESPVMVCCGYGGPPYNFNPSRRCGSPGCQVCPVGSRYISWDGVHYTEAANSIVASKILSTEYSKPPIKFDSFCSS